MRPDETSARIPHVVCLLDTLDDIGGAETLALDLLVRLDPERYRRSLFVTRWTDKTEVEPPGSESVGRLRAAGVEVRGIARSSRWDIAPWRSFLQFLRAEDVDLIHAHKFGSNAWAVLMARLARKPAVIAHEHMWSYSESGAFHRFVDRAWIARGADEFIAVSEEGRRQMIEVEGIRPADITLVKNGVARRDDRAGRAGARNTLGLAEGATVVGTVANLRSEKALEVLIEAGKLLSQTRPELRVVIVGEGPERAKLEREIARLEAQDLVLMTGYRDDVPDLLAAFDVAVCCSDFEGGPLSVMEYMDAGLPVVATDVGGLPELIRHEETGLLVPPRDPHALAAAASRLLDDQSLGSRLGDAGKVFKREQHDVEAWVARIEEIYARVLAERA